MDMPSTIENAEPQAGLGYTAPNGTITSTGLVSSRQVAIGAIALALAVALGWSLVAHQAVKAVTPPAPTLGVATPLVAPVVEWDDYVGRFAPSQMVEVRPRVAGQVTALHFRDGDLVHKGQVLFTIDQRPYRAALAEAQANVAAARSTLTLAQSDYTRAARLSGDEAVSAGEVDGLRARLQSAQASLAAAEARARQRALDMEFTEVRAPITGRISDRRVDIGNLVAAGDGANATLLTTINALDPIYFNFDSSEALFLKAQRDKAAHGTAPDVEIKLQDEPGYQWHGRLDFTDNGLDPHSGTIRGRAVIDNPDHFLTPGMFGHMRLLGSGSYEALLVPDRAVVTDQERQVVFVVDDKGVAHMKPIDPGPLTNGLRVVRSGLLPGDRVVIDGVQRAQGGKPVKPIQGRIEAEPNPPARLDTGPPASTATAASEAAR